MLDAVKRIALIITLVLVACLIGCTSLLSDLGMDSTVALEPHTVETSSDITTTMNVADRVAYMDSIVALEPYTVGTSSKITTTMNVAERVAYRVARESSYYLEVSDAIRQGANVYIERPAANVQIVVFGLEPSAANGIEEGFVVFPYVAFMIDSLSREVVEVYKVTPMLSERLMTIESLRQRTTTSRELSDGIVEELEIARARSASETQVRPKDYLCNPDGYSYRLCFCTNPVPAHYLPGYQACREGCADNPTLAGFVICLGMCWFDHWVPEACLGGLTCTIIEPCYPN